MVRNTSDSKVRRSENCLRRRNTTRVSRRVRGKEKGECEEEEEEEVVGGEERNRIKSGQRCALKTSNNSGCCTLHSTYQLRLDQEMIEKRVSVQF